MDVDIPNQMGMKPSSKLADLANKPPPKLARRPKSMLTSLPYTTLIIQPADEKPNIYPTDSKVHKRPINRNRAHNRGISLPSSGSIANNPKQAIIYVGTKSPFMGIVTRVRKALNNGPTGVRSNSAGKGLPLTARIAELNAPSSAATDDSVVRHEVLVRGTGRAMAKTLNIAAYFQDQLDIRISVRTMTLEAVDDVVVDDDGAEEDGGFAAEEETRIRMVSCLEVGVSLR